MQFNKTKIIIIWLLVAIFSQNCYSLRIEYFLSQHYIHQNYEKVINSKKLNSYLSNPDTFNLQLVYGWGRDIGLKHLDVGFWIADTLLQLGKIKNDHRAIISAYSLKAQMFQQKADLYNSINNYKKAIRYGEENLDYELHPNFDKLGINYVYLADLYFDIEDYNNAKKFYTKGWDILKKITDKMIRIQDTINKHYHREYTTYHWDKLYSRLRLGVILTYDNKTIDKGIKILEEVLKTENKYEGLLKVNACFYLANAYMDKNSILGNIYLDSAYNMAKYGKIYDIQSKIGLSKLEKIKSINEFDTSLAIEVKMALDYTNNSNLKYRLFNMLSKYYSNKDIFLSNIYLDSAFNYIKLFYDEENLKEIGKIQSDIEYESDIAKINIEKEASQQRFYLVLVVAIIILFLMLILISFYTKLKKLQSDLENKNEKITDQNKKLAELIESREKLLGILGHDLRNPIKGFRLSIKKILTENINKNIDKDLIDLEQKSNQVENLLNSILTYSESNLNVPLFTNEYINLEEIINSSIALNEYFIKNKKLEIVKNIEVTNIKSNIFIIISVISNLINNAVKFSFENTTIKITTYTEDGFLIIKIEDNGIGIDEENLEKIRNQIKPKIQEGIKSPKGNGFGLLTSISQLEKIDANLFIESEKGIGTTIMIYINSY